MARTMGRRARFFLVVVAVSLALYYPTPEEFRWVCLFTTGLAGFWVVMLTVEDLLKPGRGPRPRPRLEIPDRSTPFAPPPPPGERPLGG
jgi:hypothetical protein